MSDVLICAGSLTGHVAPMNAIGAHLVGRGHRVRLITGSRFRDLVTAAGIEHVPLRAAADIDDTDLGTALPGRAGTRGLAKIRHEVTQLFIEPMRPQWDVLQEQIAVRRPDVILAENAFTGICPLLLGSGPRPPVLGCGVIPLTRSSPHTPPFGPGLAYVPGLRGRVRNRVLNWLIRRVVFAKQHEQAVAALVECDPEVRLDNFFMDGMGQVDLALQLTIPSFEYPRPDLPDVVRFAGPVLPTVRADTALPEWWGDLDTDRPIVLVTQGTLDVADLDKVIGPTLRGLAGDDVLVVAVTGGPPIERLGRLPDNARAATLIPFAALLPHVSVMVTSGGYGGVHFSLAHGVPLVVAGDAEDKMEVAARVAWSGAGINLRTGSPSPEGVAGAVRRVLGEPEFRRHAERLRAEIAATDALATAAEAVNSLTAGGPRHPTD